jgi:hypothetical protein
MGNGASVRQKEDLTLAQWRDYCRGSWRSLRSRQLDEFSGLKRPALKRGQSRANLGELVKKLTQEPLAMLSEEEDTGDLTSAIAKLNSSAVLHTEKRAIERLLAQRYEDALRAAARMTEADPEVLGGASEVLRQVLLVFRSNELPTELDKSDGEVAQW